MESQLLPSEAMELGSQKMHKDWALHANTRWEPTCLAGSMFFLHTKFKYSKLW